MSSFEWAWTGSDVLNWSILTKICSGEHKVVKYYFSDLPIWRNCNKIEALRSALPGRGYGCCTAHQATDNSYDCLEQGRHDSGFLIIQEKPISIIEASRFKGPRALASHACFYYCFYLHILCWAWNIKSSFNWLGVGTLVCCLWQSSCETDSSGNASSKDNIKICIYELNMER